MPRNAHLLDARGRLNASDYAALCWPVLERLTAAKLVNGISTAASARVGAVLRMSAVDRRDLREAADSEHELIRVNGTAVTGRRPPLCGSVRNGLYATPVDACTK